MWNWGRPRRDIPQVNYAESTSEEEENFADGLVFNSPLTSPQRPLHTREGSPVDTVEGGPTLADNVDDTLEEVQYKLHDIAVVREEIEEVTDLLEDTDTRVASDKLETSQKVVEDIFEIKVAGPADTEVCEENIAAVMPPATTFETENGEDDDRALSEALRQLSNYQWNQNDLLFYFGQIEIKMAANGVKKQFTKFQVLSTIIPAHVIEEVKSLLIMSEADFTDDDSYLQLKNEILSIFGPRQEDGMERALSRVLTGKPSTLARQLVHDIAKGKLECDNCTATIAALWKRQLSSSVKAGIAHLKLSKANFKEVVQLADDIYSSNSHSSAASVASVTTPSAPPTSSRSGANALNETQPALPYPIPEVNAVRNTRGGRGRGNRGRGSRGRGSGGTQASSGSAGTSRQGPKHPDLPPGEWSGCNMHRKFGRGAYFCAEPGTCPWRNVFATKPPKQ